MHSYLKSIGYSQIEDAGALNKLLQQISEQPSVTHTYWAKEGKSTYVEFSLQHAGGAGIRLCGEYEPDGHFVADHYFPYLQSSKVSVNEEITVNKRVDTDAYTGMCDDYRIGVSLIFYIQNALDYMEKGYVIGAPFECPVRLSALSLEGKILMPIAKTTRQLEFISAETVNRNKLISEAKKGNREAIESLTIDDIDKYSAVSQRLEREDIYSIVENSFVPYGSESDNYSIVGTIVSSEVIVNPDTSEPLVHMAVECNQIPLDVCISRSDLLGEPKPGRRFKGNVWLHGYLDFDVK